MKLSELKKMIDAKTNDGFGNKQICVDGQPEFDIDSIQSNRNPGIEPDYFIIMTSGEFRGLND